MENLSFTWEQKKNEYQVQITKQILRGNDFYNNANFFMASNGVCLYSSKCPEILTEGIIFVLGEDRTSDKNLLIFETKTGFLRFKTAVEEYNTKTKYINN